MDDTRVRAALGLTAAAVFAIGVATAAGRGSPPPPASTPEEAARSLFEASLRGDCEAALDLMTPEMRRDTEDAYTAMTTSPDQARELLCLALRAEPGTKLNGVTARERDENAAIVLVVAEPPGREPETSALLMVRRDGRWLNATAEPSCAEPRGAFPDRCDRFELTVPG